MIHRVLLLTALLAVACSDAAQDGGSAARPQPEPLSDEARARLAAHRAPSTWEDLDPEHPGRRLRDPRTDIEFVRIPRGTFRMGGGNQPQEQPQHPVELTQDYLLAATELTVAQWQRYVVEWGGDPAVELPQSGGTDSRLPMTLSFRDARRFAATFSYRLPTEAEWERACTGGLERADEPWATEAGMREHAWFHRNADYRAHPVGQKAANPYGLHDMLGNLWEWCVDDYDPTAYEGRKSGAKDPKGTTEGTHRIIRGGSWFSVPPATPRTRLAEDATKRTAFYGARFAANAPER